MINKRMLTVFKILALVFVSFSTSAINIVIQNATVNPNPINPNGNFTVTIDMINSADATIAENANNLQVTIDNFGLDLNANFDFLVGTESFGWVCIPVGVPVTSLTCTKLFTTPPFPADDTTVETLSFDMSAGASPISVVDFNVDVLDIGIGSDDQPFNNSITINASVGAGGLVPDLAFDAASTQMIYNGIENQVAPITLDFSVLNNGADASLGAGLDIFHDEFLFSLDQANSTIPVGWTCITQTGGTNCSTTNMIVAASTTNFSLAYDVSAAGQGNYQFNGSLFDFSFTETNTSNNNISTDIVLAMASPDLDMNIVTPNTFPVHVDQGSTAPTPFTFRVSNIGNTDFQNGDVSVFIGHDPLFTIANVQTAAPGWTCGPATGGFECFNTSSSVLPLDQIDFSGEITAYPTAIMEYPSAVFAVVTDLTGAEATAGLDLNNDFDVSVGIVPLDTDLEIQKFAKDGPGVANLISGDWPLGTNFFYQIHVNNLSTTAGTLVEVNDPLPAGLQFVSDLSGGSWNCTVDPFVDEFTSQGVVCNHPSIPASSPNFNELIVLEVQPLNLGMKSNAAVVSSAENDSDPLNNDNIASPSVVNIVNPANDPDVDITKIFLSGVTSTQQGTFADQNSEVVYKILAKNNSNGADVATNVTISDTLPAGVSFVSFNEIGPNFNGNCTFIAGTGPSGQVTCNAASLPFTTNGDDGVDIKVNVTGVLGSFIDNTATVTADNDSTPGNNSSSSGPFEVVDIAQIDLAMFKDAQTLGGVSATSFNEGENFNYVLTVSNSGLDDAAAAEVIVTDMMPPDIDIVGITSAVGWDCSNSDLVNGFVECLNTTAINTAGSQEIFIEVVSNVSGNYDNTADVNLSLASSAVDTDPNNNSDNVVIDIQSVGTGDLVFTKGFVFGKVNRGGNDVFVGDSFQYTLNVENVSFGTLYNDLVVTDSIDPNLSVQSVASDLSGFNCNAVGNDVTCTQDGSNPLNPGSSTLITIDVFASNDGFNIDNVANITSASTAEDFNSNVVTINVLPLSSNQVNLDILKDAQNVGGTTSVDNFLVGESFEYKLVVHNTGPNDAPIGEVKITDVLPLDIDLDAIPTSADWDCSSSFANTVQCLNTVVIPANTGFLTLIIPVSSQQAGSYLNSADVSLVGGATVTDIDLGNNNDSFNVTINPVAGNLTLIKSVTGGSVQTLRGVKNRLLPNPNFAIGDQVIYTLVSTNNSSINAVTDLVITDALDTNFLSFDSFNIIQSAPNFNCNIDGSGLVTCANSSTGPLNPGETFEVEIVATAIAAGFNVSNTANLSSANTGDNFDSNTVLIDIDSGILPTTLNVVKEAFVNGVPVSSITKGSSYSYKITIQNTGNEGAQNLSLVDNMPTDVTVVNSIGTDWTCSNAGQVYTCDFLNTLFAGETTIVEFEVVDETNNNVSQIQNVVDVSADNAPLVSEVNVIDSIITTDIIDVSIEKTASVSNIEVNGNFDYLLTVTNNSSITANGVQVTDTLPNGIVFNSVQGTDWSCNGTSNIVCNISSLAANATSTIIIDVNAPSVIGTVSNTAQVSINAQDPNTTNNTSQVTINVTDSGQTGVADLSIIKTASAKSVNSGNQFNWNIDVSNNGPDLAEDVVINDNLPTNFELISATINGSDACKVNNTNLICNIGNLNNGETQTLTILGVASLDSGMLENSATVSSNTNDPITENNADTANILVEPIVTNSADVYVAVTTEAPVIDGGNAQFNINTGNNGPDSSQMPSINMTASGNINQILLDFPSDWNCQTSDTMLINCTFIGSEMLNGFESEIHVKLIPNEPMGSEEQTLGLTATISSETDDPDLSNNTGSAEIITTGGLPTEQEILAAMQSALSGIANQQTLQAIENVASYCGNRYENALDGLCDNLYNAALNGEGQLLNEVMEQITPNEIIGQSSSVSELATAQFRNVGTRLSQLRGGGGSGFSTAGLNARYGNGSLPIGMLAYLNDSPDESGGLSKPDPDFISPWGFFVNGTISMGERDATGRELGFDFDTFGLTAGIDYRLDNNKVIGVALGYANFDSKIEDSAKLNSTGLTLTGYGSFNVNDNFYVDTRISIAKPEFDQSRNIDFDIDDISVNRTAVGKTDANQYSFAMSAGYNINKKAWNITPNVSVNYVKTNIDGFTETGAGDYNFIFTDQEIESLVWSAGMKVSKAISLKNGVITPQFDFDYNYESLNDGNNIEARFIMAPEDEVFIIETDSPDRTYGSAGIGLVYITSNGKQAYVNYRSILGLEGFDRGTFNLGARFEF